MTLTVHPKTQQLIDVLQRDLPQSLLLSGPYGVGLTTIARHLAGDALLSFVEPRNAKEEPDASGTINVDLIRRLYTETHAKHTSRQVVILDNADRMNSSGQSAFLKLLEEPNPSIHFILVSHHPGQLKDTIRSRVQHHTISPITAEQTAAFIQSLGVTDTKKQAQLTFVASGLPAELSRLARDDDYFQQQAKIVGDARTYLQGTSYQRIVVAHQYHSNREKAVRLVTFALQIARRTMSNNPQQGLLQQIERLSDAHAKLLANGNVKLVLAVAMI